MRSPALLLASALALAAASAPAHADEYRYRPRPARAPRQRAAAISAAPRPAPTYARAAPAPYSAPRYRSSAGVAVVAAPFWWGWGWGYGYYPLYPRYASSPGPAYPGYAPEEPGGVPPDPDALRVRLSGTVTAASGGGAAGVALAVEGRTAGASFAFEGLAKDGVTGLSGQDHHAIGWGSAHATWSILTDEVARVRLELGGSMLALPEGGLAAGQPWAGKVAFGPDIGVSGQLGLIGPIGIEGYARVTPFPVAVVDTRIALALRGGPLALTAGWRNLRIAGDGTNAPDVALRGPELGLAVGF